MESNVAELKEKLQNILNFYEKEIELEDIENEKDDVIRSIYMDDHNLSDDDVYMSEEELATLDEYNNKKDHFINKPEIDEETAKKKVPWYGFLSFIFLVIGVVTGFQSAKGMSSSLYEMSIADPTFIFTFVSIPSVVAWIALGNKIKQYENIPQQLEQYQEEENLKKAYKKCEEKQERINQIEQDIDEYCLTSEADKRYEEYISDTKEQYANLKNLVKDYIDMVPRKYNNIEDIEQLIEIIDDGRADTLKEAINVYISDIRAQEAADLQMQRYQEELRHNSKLEELQKQQIIAQQEAARQAKIQAEEARQARREAERARSQANWEQRQRENAYNSAARDYESASRRLEESKQRGNDLDARNAAEEQARALANMMKNK